MKVNIRSQMRATYSYANALDANAPLKTLQQIVDMAEGDLAFPDPTTYSDLFVGPEFAGYEPELLMSLAFMLRGTSGGLWTPANAIAFKAKVLALLTLISGNIWPGYQKVDIGNAASDYYGAENGYVNADLTHTVLFIQAGKLIPATCTSHATTVRYSHDVGIVSPDNVRMYDVLPIITAFTPRSTDNSLWILRKYGVADDVNTTLWREGYGVLAMSKSARLGISGSPSSSSLKSHVLSAQCLNPQIESVTGGTRVNPGASIVKDLDMSTTFDLALQNNIDPIRVLSIFTYNNSAFPQVGADPNALNKLSMGSVNVAFVNRIELDVLNPTIHQPVYYASSGYNFKPTTLNTYPIVGPVSMSTAANISPTNS